MKTYTKWNGEFVTRKSFLFALTRRSKKSLISFDSFIYSSTFPPTILCITGWEEPIAFLKHQIKKKGKKGKSLFKSFLSIKKLCQYNFTLFTCQRCSRVKEYKRCEKFWEENENGTQVAVHTYLYIAEENLRMVVNMIFIKKFSHCTKQIHFRYRKQISKLDHFSTMSLKVVRVN